MSARLRLVATAMYGAALIWGIWRHGATETWELYRLFLLTAVGALIIAWTFPNSSLQRQKRLLPLLVVGCFLCIQISLQPTLEGRGFVLAGLGWIALFLSFAIASQGRESRRALLFFLILVGGSEAIYGLAQALSEPTSAGGAYRLYGASGTFINRNHFAGMLNMLLPLALGALYITFHRRHAGRSPRSETYAWTWVMFLSCSFMGLAVLLSLSRGGVLTLIATLAFMASILALRRKASARKRLSRLALWLLPLTILGLGLAAGLDTLSERFAFSQKSWEGRAPIYADSLQLIRDNAAFGVGPGMYRWRFRPYQTINPENRYDHAHNDYLETTADWGIPVAAMIWGFILWRFYRVFRTLFETRSIFRQGLALGCLGAMFSILLHSLVDFNLQIPTNLMIFCMILGLAWSLESPHRVSRQSHASRQSHTDRKMLKANA